MTTRWCEWKGHWKPLEVCQQLSTHGVKRCRTCLETERLGALLPPDAGVGTGKRLWQTKPSTKVPKSRARQLELFEG